LRKFTASHAFFKRLYCYVNEEYCGNVAKNNFSLFTKKVWLRMLSFWSFKSCGMLVRSHWCSSSWTFLELFDHENEDIAILVKVGSCFLVPKAWNLQRITS